MPPLPEALLKVAGKRPALPTLMNQLLFDTPRALPAAVSQESGTGCGDPLHCASIALTNRNVEPLPSLRVTKVIVAVTLPVIETPPLSVVISLLFQSVIAPVTMPHQVSRFRLTSLKAPIGAVGAVPFSFHTMPPPVAGL